jgi:hypothetical protein
MMALWQRCASIKRPMHRVKPRALILVYSITSSARASRVAGMAREQAVAVLQIQPDYTMQGMAKHFSPFRRSEDAGHFFDGLREVACRRIGS